jgi:hypothetical protein
MQRTLRLRRTVLLPAGCGRAVAQRRPARTSLDRRGRAVVSRRQAGSRGCAFLIASAQLADPDHQARRICAAHTDGITAVVRDLAAQAGLGDPGRGHRPADAGDQRPAGQRRSWAGRLWPPRLPWPRTSSGTPPLRVPPGSLAGAASAAAASRCRAAARVMKSQMVGQALPFDGCCCEPVPVRARLILTRRPWTFPSGFGDGRGSEWFTAPGQEQKARYHHRAGVVQMGAGRGVQLVKLCLVGQSHR